jgi:iron complex outermembrane recepter protein
MKLIFTFSALFFSLTFFAQKISGLIQDNKSTPIEFATVSLHFLKDSSFVKGEISDEKGSFEITAPSAGEYFIKCSYIGFNDYNSEAISLTSISKELSPITMIVSTEMLSEVTVKARKPLIEIMADKTVLNTDASLTAAGSNGLELLRKAPGVTVDNNENIQLKGKNGVRIYIDGKPSYLNDKELANLLKGLTAADIEAIEIITNPSAKFDAQGNAGIINLRLRKNKNFGTNGSLNLSAGYGVYHKSYAGINLNNRNSKFNTFGSAGIGNNKSYNALNLLRDQDGGVYDQKQSNSNSNFPLNGKIGMDYYANDKHTFGVLVNANTQYKDSEMKSTSRTLISNITTRSKIDSTLQAENTERNNSLNANANFNYRFSDTLGNEVTIDFDKGYYNSKANSLQPNTYLLGETGPMSTQKIFSSNSPSRIDINTAKIDYTKSLKKSGLSIGLGGKYANVKSDNTFDFFNQIDGELLKDLEQSNRFIYTENVAATYTNISGKINNKLNFQVGLRMENTTSIGELKREPGQQAKPDDYVKKPYTDFFPSGALTYNMNDKNAFNLTYSRRIDRPSYQDLNPFQSRIDELTYRKGNPKLTPQYNNNFELTYTAMQMASVSLSYNKSTDVVTDIVERSPDLAGKSYINYRNLASQENYAMSISSPLPIKKWWNGYVSATLYKAFYKARFPEYTFDANTPIATNVYMENSFTLPKDYAFEVSGWYNSAAIWGGSWLTEPQGSLDLGLQKKILQGKGNLKISFSDILLTAPWASYSEAIPGLKIRGSGQWESRKVMVNFSYRFGSNEVKAARNRKTGLDSENKRIKG